MSATKESTRSSSSLVLMAIAFLGIFVYGLLTALPGTVLPELERHLYLPDDGAASAFLFINAIGAVVAYCVAGPITDRIGKKFTLWVGAGLAAASMFALGLVVTKVPAESARVLVFACSLVLGLGANAIVSAGHALVGDLAQSQRNAALNLLDICFGLGLTTLPLIADRWMGGRGYESIFWLLGGAATALLVIVLTPRFPRPSHPESFPFSEAKDLFRNTSFWLLAIALFMYVGTEVSVGKWIVTFLERDPKLLAASGVDAAVLQRMAPEALTAFFKNDPAGAAAISFALGTLAIFGIALMVGRLISSFFLGVLHVNGLTLLTGGAVLCTAGLALTVTATSPATVRWAILAGGIGMGPIFPTSVGLASVIAPRMPGTAMSWVMGIGFAGLLVIPPAVGIISESVGGKAGDVRTGLLAVLTASIAMLLLHITLSIRDRRRALGVEQPKEANAAGIPLPATSETTMPTWRPNYLAIAGLICAVATLFIQPETSGPGGFGAFTHFPPAGSQIGVEWLKGLLGLAGVILGLLGVGAAKSLRTGRGLAITAMVLGSLFAMANFTQAAIWSGLIK
jgi:fucose permease